MVVVGIDPDSHGSIAVLHSSNATLAVYPIPSQLVEMTTGKRRSKTTYSALAAISVDKICNADAVWIERQWARQDESAGGSFTHGQNFGVVIGCIAAAMKASGKEPDQTIKFVTAADWKHALRIDADKKQAVALATKLFPECEHFWKRKISAAEASLIALYGLSASGVRLAPGTVIRPACAQEN